MISSGNTSPREGVCPGHSGPSAGGGGGSGTDIANNSPIQDVTQAQCQALPTYSGSNEDAIRTVTDNRGGATQTYRIAKLADNKCWMLDNLRLGSTSGSITLTPSDSNVSSNFTLPQLTTGGSPEYDDPRAYGPVPGDSGSGATNYGYLYNFSAATAGESRASHPAGAGDAPHSICAKGWRLPTGGYDSSYTSGAGDFPDLDRAFGGSGASWQSHSSTGWQYEGPFRGIYAGVWDHIGSVYSDQGVGGNFWTSVSTANYSTYTYIANIWNGGAATASTVSDRQNGNSVRCLMN